MIAKRISAGLVLAAACFSAWPAPLDSALNQATTEARDRCYKLVHDDTWAYRDCIAELLSSESRTSPRRLGIEYFGWVGAMNSQRIGLAGANQTAQEFLLRFRKTQKRLHVSDERLCSSIPGDCVARNARMLQAEKAPRLPASARD